MSINSNGQYIENPTHREIAEDRALWTEYIDTSGLTTDEEWDSATVDERIAFIVECFGTEEESMPHHTHQSRALGRDTVK